MLRDTRRVWSVRESARAERRTFADLLDELTADQWLAPSLCDGWRVCDVVAHTIAYLGQSRFGLAVEMVRARGDVDRLNGRALDGLPRDDARELAASMRAGAEPSGAGGLRAPSTAGRHSTRAGQWFATAVGRHAYVALI